MDPRRKLIASILTYLACAAVAAALLYAYQHSPLFTPHR